MMSIERKIIRRYRRTCAVMVVWIGLLLALTIWMGFRLSARAESAPEPVGAPTMGTGDGGRNDTGVVPYGTGVRADMESAPTGTGNGGRTHRSAPTETEVRADMESAPTETGGGTERTSPEAGTEGTYFRDDIALGVIEQRLLHDAAAEFGVDYALALAVVEQETDYRNIMGDGGDSLGYMQIQPRWWSDLMDRIGAVDLMEPEDNFRTGCAILAELIAAHGSTEAALTAYNTGRPGTSPYAAAVMERMG